MSLQSLCLTNLSLRGLLISRSSPKRNFLSFFTKTPLPLLTPPSTKSSLFGYQGRASPVSASSFRVGVALLQLFFYTRAPRSRARECLRKPLGLPFIILCHCEQWNTAWQSIGLQYDLNCYERFFNFLYKAKNYIYFLGFRKWIATICFRKSRNDKNNLTRQKNRLLRRFTPRNDNVDNLDLFWINNKF